MKRHLLVLPIAAAFNAALILMPIDRAMACSCAMPNEADAFAGSAVVFEGVVAAARPLPGDGFSDVAFIFAIEEELKGGPLPESLAITTSSSGASCGAEFQVGQRWRVFAEHNEGMLYSGLCSSNRLIDEREPIPPLGNDDEMDTTDGPGFNLTIPVLISLGIVALLALISLLAFRGQARPSRD